MLPEPGNLSPDQLAASPQRFVPAPPSQEMLPGEAGRGVGVGVGAGVEVGFERIAWPFGWNAI